MDQQQLLFILFGVLLVGIAVDDYNNFTRTDSLSRLGTFNSKVDIYYVQNHGNSYLSRDNLDDHWAQFLY